MVFFINFIFHIVFHTFSGAIGKELESNRWLLRRWAKAVEDNNDEIDEI